MLGRDLIFAAFPRYPAAHLEAGLGCSRRQAWRMVSTGHIPQAWRERALDVLHEAIKKQRAYLAGLEAQMKVMNYAESVATGTDRHRAVDTTATGETAGLDEGSTQPSLIALNSFRKDGQ